MIAALRQRAASHYADVSSSDIAACDFLLMLR